MITITKSECEVSNNFKITLIQILVNNLIVSQQCKAEILGEKQAALQNALIFFLKVERIVIVQRT